MLTNKFCLFMNRNYVEFKISDRWKLENFDDVENILEENIQKII